MSRFIGMAKIINGEEVWFFTVLGRKPFAVFAGGEMDWMRWFENDAQ